ncbi:hypothetical protein ACFJIY_01930 [Pimelobacter simplex]|uniref:hypothetical protein n=1 Tax=Nocardioides simplex TaxID=2045 RepID=UPI0036732290
MVLALATVTAACAAEEPARPADPVLAAPATDGWRTETWAGLSVDVPGEWTYGGAPVRSGGGERTVCPPPLTGPDDAATGQVGRPVMLSDVCAGYPWIPHSRALTSTTPYVWLGAEIPVGIVRYEGGLVQQTVARHGTTLTVGSADAGLRARILGSARPAERCRPGGVTAGETEVCGYGRGTDDALALAFAERVDPATLTATVAAAERAGEVPAGWTCPGPRRNDDGRGYVRRPADVVELRDDERTVVLDLGCESVDLGNGSLRRLTDEVLQPWAGPLAQASLRSLVGPLG